MKIHLILLLIIPLLGCNSQKKVTISTLNGKIKDSAFNALPNVEIISKDYNFFTNSDENGLFFIKSQSLINDFYAGQNIFLIIRKENYETKTIRLNKDFDLVYSNSLKEIYLTKYTIPEKNEIDTIRKEKLEKIIIESPSTNQKQIPTGGNTTNDIGTVNNNGSMTIGTHNDITINEGSKTTVINEGDKITQIIKETSVIEIPFEERDCAQKEIGYALIKNNYNEGINIKLITYGPKKGPMALRFEYYTISKNTSKLLRLHSDYYYDINGERFSEKWAGTFVYGFNDGFFVTPCDTQLISTP